MNLPALLEYRDRLPPELQPMFLNIAQKCEEAIDAGESLSAVLESVGRSPDTPSDDSPPDADFRNDPRYQAVRALRALVTDYLRAVHG